jgi:hypothetical protein
MNTDRASEELDLLMPTLYPQGTIFYIISGP